MEFIDIPTEQTTAATDIILALIALGVAIYLKNIRQHCPWKATLWIWVFCLISFASLLGALAHGFIMSDQFRSILWYLIYLSLGLVVALFVVGGVYDIYSEMAAKRLLRIMLVIGVVFFLITIIWSDSFIVFIVYEITALLFALGGYIWLAYKKSFQGAYQMSTGILLTVIAAVAQADSSILFDFIWKFDHNGIYHLIQMAGVIFLMLGLRGSILLRK